MILLFAVAAGLTVGLGLAHRKRVRYEAPVFQFLWLMFIAFGLQFVLPRLSVSTSLFAVLLITSQILLFVFALFNHSLPGMKALTLGAVLNLLVMIANGGFMPIRPQAAAYLVPECSLLDFPAGARFGAKDIILMPEATRFELLADRFLTPAWFPYQSAFSLGDVLIAAGAFWLLARPAHSIQR